MASISPSDILCAACGVETNVEFCAECGEWTRFESITRGRENRRRRERNYRLKTEGAAAAAAPAAAAAAVPRFAQQHRGGGSSGGAQQSGGSGSGSAASSSSSGGGGSVSASNSGSSPSTHGATHGARRSSLGPCVRSSRDLIIPPPPGTVWTWGDKLLTMSDAAPAAGKVAMEIWSEDAATVLHASSGGSASSSSSSASSSSSTPPRAGALFSMLAVKRRSLRFTHKPPSLSRLLPPSPLPPPLSVRAPPHCALVFTLAVFACVCGTSHSAGTVFIAMCSCHAWSRWVEAHKHEFVNFLENHHPMCADFQAYKFFPLLEPLLEAWLFDKMSAKWSEIEDDLTQQFQWWRGKVFSRVEVNQHNPNRGGIPADNNGPETWNRVEKFWFNHTRSLLTTYLGPGQSGLPGFISNMSRRDLEFDARLNSEVHSREFYETIRRHLERPISSFTLQWSKRSKMQTGEVSVGMRGARSHSTPPSPPRARECHTNPPTSMPHLSHFQRVIASRWLISELLLNDVYTHELKKGSGGTHRGFPEDATLPEWKNVCEAPGKDGVQSWLQSWDDLRLSPRTKCDDWNFDTIVEFGKSFFVLSPINDESVIDGHYHRMEGSGLTLMPRDDLRALGKKGLCSCRCVCGSFVFDY